LDIKSSFCVKEYMVAQGKGKAISDQLAESVPAKGSNNVLRNANKAKKDEFYTQLSDIEKELKNYRTALKGKTVYCNCDDPYESNFFKFFAANFNALGLKKLITTSFIGSPIVGGQLDLFDMEGLKPEGRQPLKLKSLMFLI